MAARLFLAFCLALAVLHISPGFAGPPTLSQSSQPAAVVVLVSDHLGPDDRAASYAAALRAAQIAVVVVDPPPNWSRWDGDTFPAERLLQPLFGTLLTVRKATPLGMPRVGVLGLGLGGEAALMAAFEQSAAAATSGEDLRFDAHVALYPTCGPGLTALLRTGAMPTLAPVLIVQPWAEENRRPGFSDCEALTDTSDTTLRERVSVLVLNEAGYGFDMPGDGTMQHVLPHPTGEGHLVAVPQPAAAELTLQVMVNFFAAALRP